MGKTRSPGTAHANRRLVQTVTKRDFEGAEAQLLLDRPTAAGGDAEHASALWGGEAGNGHLTIGADVFRRGDIRHADREFSRARWRPGGSFGDAEGVSVAGNTFFYEVNEESRGGYLGNCDPNQGYVGPLSEPYGLTGEGCGFADADFSWQPVREDRHTVFANGDILVRDDLTLHADARSSREVIKQRGSPRSHILDITPTHALLDQIRTRYPDFPANFRYRRSRRTCLPGSTTCATRGTVGAWHSTTVSCAPWTERPPLKSSPCSRR